MTLTNHVLTGAVISRLVPLPLAVPLAFASHFLLDSLPHFGFRKYTQDRYHKKLMRTVIGFDVLAFCMVSFWLITRGDVVGLLVGLVAFSPDLMWIYRFVFQEELGKIPPKQGGRFMRFHEGIQRYEFKQGWVIEALFGVGVVYALTLI